MIRAGYLFSRSPSETADPFVEHTATLEAVGRAPLPWGCSCRIDNRGDFRFVHGDDGPYAIGSSWNERLRLGACDLTPYGHAEVFYDWTFDKFTRFRYAAGAEASLWRQVAFEVYYLRQEDTVSSTKHVNVVGAALQFYFQ